MSQPEPPSFHVRLPSQLKAKLNAARGRNSLNREIIERLERTFDPDPALPLADIARPFLAKLDAADRAKAIELVAQAIEVLAKGLRKKGR
ncbi:hypothetical protein LB519_14870 [Mesorhizobium sp. AD1-1]|uniref:hypothetical protein n=1 Tax=Mesorhizobium sp. AD1-1 TaxID=2876621 RepID=UPI001CCCFED6|nr:hypothetical protein [Mesorhizobium sp. AD1-1]MBZ9719129.1 hypothetical protein [Mesorhizobium sp. AD1-1]